MSIYIHRVVFTHRLFCGMLSRTVYPYVRFFMGTFRTLSSFRILQQPSFIHSPSLYQLRCYTCSLSFSVLSSLSLSFSLSLSIYLFLTRTHTLSISLSISLNSPPSHAHPLSLLLNFSRSRL